MGHRAGQPEWGGAPKLGTVHWAAPPNASTLTLQGLVQLTLMWLWVWSAIS